MQLIYILLVTISMIHCSQSFRWTGRYKPDSKCNSDACCCPDGVVTIKNGPGNELSISTGLSGPNMFGTCFFQKEGSINAVPHGDTLSTSVYGYKLTAKISSDSMTITYTNDQGSKCDGTLYKISEL